MTRFNELVNEYYDAIFAEDEQRKQAVMNELRSVIYTILLTWGTQHFSELAQQFDELPASLVYSPSDEMVDRVTADMRENLLKLEDRMYEEIQKELDNNPELTLSAAYLLAKSKNYWQVELITDSEDHIYEENSEIDVITEVFSNLGYVIEKTWVAIVDSETCPVCLAMNGTTIPFTEVFVYNENEITIDSHYSDFAHAHPHCRCHLEYSIRRE